MAEQRGESQLRSRLGEILRSQGLHVSAVEGGTMGGTPGLPDHHYAGKGVLTYNDPLSQRVGLVAEERDLQGWIEYKRIDADNLAKRALAGSIPVVTGLEHYTAQQRVWHKKACRAGVMCHLWLQIDFPHAERTQREWHYLFWGETAADLLGKTMLFRHFQPYSCFDPDHRASKFPDKEHILRALMRRTHTGQVIP